MTNTEFEDFLVYVRTHTALGQVSHGELRDAFERAKQEAGYEVVKSVEAR